MDWIDRENFTTRGWESWLVDDIREFQNWQKEARERFVADSVLRTVCGEKGA